MITTRCLMLMVLVKYVSPIPLSKGENGDIQVMKCIVEVIADALSRPHPLPVSQHCLDTLRTDERLVSILRHRNFLKELQDIAEEGANERAQQSESQASMTGQVTKLPQNAPEDLEANPDRSMLLAGVRPGEKRAEEEEGVEEEELESTEREATESQESQESQEGNEIEGKEQERSREEQNPSNHISDSMNQEIEGEVVEKEKEEEGEGKEEEVEEKEERKKQSSLEEEQEEGEETVAKNGKVGGGQGDTSEAKPTSAEEDKRTVLDSAQADSKKKRVGEEVHVGGEEEERGVGVKRWSGLTHQPRGLQAQRRAKVEQEEVLQQEEEEEEEEERRRSGHYQKPQEPPHHSKEESHEEEARPGLQSSPEERELRMMAKREPEDRRDEEGSASRKSEEPEIERIERLAAIESELENVAQKLHELRG